MIRVHCGYQTVVNVISLLQPLSHTVRIWGLSFGIFDLGKHNLILWGGPPLINIRATCSWVLILMCILRVPHRFMCWSLGLKVAQLCWYFRECGLDGDKGHGGNAFEGYRCDLQSVPLSLLPVFLSWRLSSILWSHHYDVPVKGTELRNHEWSSLKPQEIRYFLFLSCFCRHFDTGARKVSTRHCYTVTATLIVETATKWPPDG